MKNLPLALAFCLLATLLAGCKGGSTSGSKSRIRGEFSHNGNSFLINAVEPDFTTTDVARHRLIRYAYFHKEPKIYVGDNAILATTSGGKSFSAYIGGDDPIWVAGSSDKGDWREAFKNVPDDQVAALANLTREENVVFKKGAYSLKSGDPFPIPDDWLLLDEWLGSTPEASMDSLKHIGSSAWCNCRIVKSLEPKGWLKYGRMHVKESSGRVRHIVTNEKGAPAGFVVEVKYGYMILDNRAATASEIAEIEKLANFIAAHSK